MRNTTGSKLGRKQATIDPIAAIREKFGVANPHTAAVETATVIAAPLAFKRNVKLRPTEYKPLTPEAIRNSAPYVEGTAPQPVNQVYWIHRDSLFANGYNPNHVAAAELELLALSILEDGWTQPIVARSSGEVVDGFHRWSVSGRIDVGSRTEFFVPVVFLDPNKSESDQMLSTIRHNRASGEHAVVPMALIVRKLQEDMGMSQEEVERRLGMEADEVERLSDHAGMPIRISRKTTEFRKAYVPEGAETL